MTNNTLNKIKQAEVDQEKEIEKAKNAAADIIGQVKSDSDHKVNEASANAEKVISEAVQKAEEKAFSIRKKHEANANIMAKEIIDKAKKKSSEAVAIVVQELIGQWQ